MIEHYGYYTEISIYILFFDWMVYQLALTMVQKMESNLYSRDFEKFKTALDT